MDTIHGHEAIDPSGTFDTLYGLEVLEVSEGMVEARVAVTKAVTQPFGLVHGGLFCSVAESLASMGTWLAVKEEGKVAMGLSNQTSFLRPITSGYVNAVARAVHRGRTTWIWDVEMRDDNGRMAALSRMTIAVREPA